MARRKTKVMSEVLFRVTAEDKGNLVLHFLAPAAAAQTYATECGKVGASMSMPATELFKLGATLMEAAREVALQGDA